MVVSILPLPFMLGTLLDRRANRCIDYVGHCFILMQEEYSAAHQCFITENSLYVLCWKASDGEQGIHELKDWLLTIKVKPCI